MADSLKNPHEAPEKDPSEGDSGKLIKTPFQAGDTLGFSCDKPEAKIDFLLAPMVPWVDSG